MIWRHIASNFLTLLIVILIAAAAAIAWAKHQYSAPGPSAVAACVRVAPGASLAAVSEQLAAQGVVSNAYIFRAGTDYAGKSRDLKFGSYLMPPHSSMEDVVKVNCWLDDPRDFSSFNAVFERHFIDHPPARSTVQSRLMIDAKVEIDVLAWKPVSA